MTISRRAPTAKVMRLYFEDIGFVLRHRVTTTNAPERWWLSYTDGTLYPLPGGAGEEGAMFPTSQKLWRGWAANLASFEHEAACVDLIGQRLANAPIEERVAFDRWLRSHGECFDDRQDGVPLDVDGNPVDESVWPWSSMRVSSETGHLETRDWPWAATLTAPAPTWDVLRRAGWAERAQALSVSDVRSPDLYFSALEAALGHVGNDPGAGRRHPSPGMQDRP